MIKKIILNLLLITAFFQTVNGQQKESGIFVDSLGQVYLQTNMPAYFFIAPENNQGLKTLITSDDPKSNPMYFDGNGTHYLKTLDAKTNKVVSFKILADGIAPVVKLKFNNLLVNSPRKRFYVELGSVATIQATDNLSGVRSVFVSVDHSDYSNVTTVRFDKERDYSLKTFAIDNVGNISDTVEFRVITAVDSIFKFKNIYFDVDSSGLRPESKIELDDFVQILKEYPEIRIELRAHSDSRGDDTYNLNLSKTRAETVVKYLISKGIDKNRLSFKGYGNTQPVNECKKGVECSEEKYQMNRRVEFRILPIK
jgi:outer membrane protein OmpA-like peptidoglycan-associated protein